MRYFEDFVVGMGSVSEGVYELEASEIVEFCERWDPLPFHTDEEAAARTPVGTLFTSAIHTVAIAIRMGHGMNDEPVATEIGLGWDDVRFHTPACAGDQLRLHAEITEARVSKSRPDVGVIGSRLRLTNQRGAEVISFRTAALIRRRPR
ncbi:MAG: MaoC family dehydratase N-terminal domain-containing protein [Polyangiales bacterium]